VINSVFLVFQVGTKFLVEFIDYGCEQIQDITELKVLINEFSALPAQGVRCSLTSGGYTVPADRETLKTCILQQELVVRAQNPVDGVYPVLVVDCQVNEALLDILTPR